MAEHGGADARRTKLVGDGCLCWRAVVALDDRWLFAVQPVRQDHGDKKGSELCIKALWPILHIFLHQHPNTEMSTPKRRWYQFNLRTLLLAMAVVAIVLAQWPPIRFLVESRKTEWGGYTRPYVWVNPRFQIGTTLEIIAIIGWLWWRRFKKYRARLPGS
jgi:hypothetical protein